MNERTFSLKTVILVKITMVFGIWTEDRPQFWNLGPDDLQDLAQVWLRMLKIANNSSYRHKIELSLRFSGKNTYFKQLFKHFYSYSMWFYLRKNIFYDGTKKILCKKFLGLFVHVQRWVVQKTLLEKPELFWRRYTQIPVRKIFPLSNNISL